MKPLIKWPGGKSQEFEKIEKTIPENYKRYVEPFFGGGAVFFALKPEKAAINDISEELMQFYSHIKNKKSREEFKRELYLLTENWEKIKEYAKIFRKDFLEIYERYRNDKITDTELRENLKELFERRIKQYNGMFEKQFSIYPDKLIKQIENSTYAKLKRTKNKVDVHNKFDEAEIMKNIETAFRSGFYTHMRSIYNLSRKENIISPEKQSAIFYFIREFCYAAMFRYNRSGEFNIPYGGSAYNEKDFRKKIDAIFSNEIIKLFENAEIGNEDFESFIKRLNLSEQDFLFLDPPYDTEFRDYAQNTFDKKDQERLARLLYETKAKFILIIKETDFIKKLYSNKKNNINMTSFDKTYLYNVKGRNERDVNHLIIKNFL